MLEEKMKDLGDTTLYTGETYVRKKKKKNIEHSANKKERKKRQYSMCFVSIKTR